MLVIARLDFPVLKHALKTLSSPSLTHIIPETDMPHSSIRHFGRRTALAALAAAASMLSTGPAAAQAYPNKPIKLVVPFSAGGGYDVLARAVGQKMAASLAHLRHQALQIRFKSTTWNQKSARMALHLCSAAQRTSNLAA